MKNKKQKSISGNYKLSSGGGLMELRHYKGKVLIDLYLDGAFVGCTSFNEVFDKFSSKELYDRARKETIAKKKEEED